MAINTKGFTALVQAQVAAIQASAAGLIDFSVGSILRAVVEAIAQVVLWLQGLILALLAATRAATSTGSDLDSWVADFGLTRLAAFAASGSVVFSRFTATSQGLVPVGTLVATSDGSQQFAVIADPSNPAYSAPLGGYALAVNVASVTAPVRAVVPGVAGNVAGDSVTILVSAAPGIDTALNPLAFSGGQDAESDTALRARFIAFLGSLRTSNTASIAYAVSSVQAGLRFAIVQDQTYPALFPTTGYFFIVVDDGSGAPPQSLLDAVFAAVDLVRGAGIQFGVYPPTQVTLNVAMTLTTVPSTVHAIAVAAVAAALQAYVQTLPLGAQTVPLTRLAQVAYDATPGISNVTGVAINGVAADFSVSAFQVPEAGTMTVA